MAINFIPNDPRAGHPPAVVVDPRPERPDGLARFVYQGAVPEDTYPTASDGFLFWQCREAALRAVDLWELVDGTSLTAWQGGATLRLKHKTPGQAQLNAFYDRLSLSFFQVDAAGGVSYRSGASTDVVAHEAGHAFLDAIRPDLWGSFQVEQGAFHEAFGDCIAILVALQDKETRQALVDQSLLRQRNFVETTAEDLSHGIAALVDANHNAAVPRRALNTHQWVMPASLPVTGGPGVLINEVHSLGMIFSGCFYDTLSNIYQSRGVFSEKGLLAAARAAGELLVAAARTAPLKPRFFQAIGNSMLIVDATRNAGVNAQAIQDGFAAHNVLLNAEQLTSPTVMLAGRPPTEAVQTVRDVLTHASRRSLLEVMGEGAGQKFYGTQLQLGGRPIAAVRRRQKVPLGDVSSSLEGVYCYVEEDVLIGEQNGNAALLGEVETVQQSVAEVQSFVFSLHAAGQISEETGSGPGEDNIGAVSHAVRGAGEERQLVRKRFNCRCHGLPGLARSNRSI
ncbi:gluzincin family metallopeptidase [Roseibium sp. LAB1]